MTCRIVLGAQWGDEGKGKIVDYLSADADAVVRCQGGANAGHTVVVAGRKLVLHLVPSGALHPHCEILLGNGMVVDPLALTDEIEALERAGVALRSRLRLSTAAHAVLPCHRLQDQVEERRRGGGGIGTTGRGIGPAYADKAARSGIPLGWFKRADSDLRATLQAATQLKLEWLRAVAPDLVIEMDDGIERLVAAAAVLRPLLCDTTQRLHTLVDANKRILLEGAQGALLDLDHGSYPYVTSSSCTAAGVLSGCGLAPRDVTGVIGVVKAYATRVGNGPFPSEIAGADGDRLRQLGHEFGATTGRPRRCGWFDAVAVRHAARISGCTELALTKLDVLDGFERVMIADGYLCEGELLRHFPSDAETLAACTPHYVEAAGWGGSTPHCRRERDLPDAARRYVARVEDLVGVPVKFLSVGPEREATLHLGGDSER